MENNILDFHGSSLIANYIRLGYNNHRKVEDLHAAGKLSTQRVVVEANYLERQVELLSTLRATGSDLVLDVKAAELSEIGSYQSSVRYLPWANTKQNKPLQPSDFNESLIALHAEHIALFAIKYRVSSILSPSHYIDSPNSKWLEIDRQLCIALREALNTEGGTEIGVDYMLNTNSQALNDEASRKVIMRNLDGLPFKNLWLRIAGFGNDASAAGLRRYINTLWDIQSLEKPLVADHVGGYVGLALLAFGAVGAISHGVATKETFYLRSWTHKSEWSGGSKSRFYLPDIDLFLSLKQANVLMAGYGAKNLLACKDDDCCSRGLKSMDSSPEEHFLFQRAKQLQKLNNIPRLKRVEHFLNDTLHNAVLKLHKTERIKLDDEPLMKKIVKHTRRLERISLALADLHETTQIHHKALVPNRCKIDSSNQFTLNRIS